MGWRLKRKATAAACLTLAFLGLGASVQAQTEPAKPPAPKLGLSLNDPRAFQGYTLLAPMMSTKTYLIDMQGKVVRQWQSDCRPALTAFLLDSGHLLRPGTLDGKQGGFGGPGAGGRIQEFTWDGELVWDFKYLNDRQRPHHDITRLPNGNILMIVSDKKTDKEAIAAGRRPQTVRNSHLLPDALLEIRPTGKTTGEVVWEWHLWDHLVQDLDSSKANYGHVAAHPELVDLNYSHDALAPILAKKGGLDKLKSIGYVGGPTGGKKGRTNPDWTHLNAVAYNPDLDQILLSIHAFSEIWVIDHGTTTAEAASHTGGKAGKGGDLLYRWGNPQAYRAGTTKDQRLFAQHNAHWITRGLPGAGHILVFNNGGRRPGGNYSSVDEIIPPVDTKGHYAYKEGKAYGPDQAVWSYAAPKKSDFFSMLISGAQRLANGNTLICSGVNGTLFEVTPAKEVVWKYINPVKAEGPGPGGFGPPPFGGPGFGAPSRPGQILPSFLQGQLKLSDSQKKQLDELQKTTDRQLARILTAAQRKQLKELPGRFPPFGGFGPGGPGRPGFGPPGGTSLFRAYRYAADFPGLAGRNLTAAKTIEELQTKAAQ